MSPMPCGSARSRQRRIVTVVASNPIVSANPGSAVDHSLPEIEPKNTGTGPSPATAVKQQIRLRSVCLAVEIIVTCLRRPCRSTLRRYCRKLKIRFAGLAGRVRNSRCRNVQKCGRRWLFHMIHRGNAEPFCMSNAFGKVSDSASGWSG